MPQNTLSKILTFILVTAVLGTGAGSLWAAEGVRIEAGKKVTLTYKLLVKGTLLEEADVKNPFTYLHGKNQIVPGLEKGLTGLRAGEKKTVQVPTREAYGPPNPQALQEIPRENLPKDVSATKGTLLEATSPEGMTQVVKIVEVKPKSVVIDFNHPLAGKDLEFQVVVLRVETP
ncbi:MAG: peptidylprolyl isomerase [Candidatus Omnitrophica bacterium]|nr:peptidylprolyl isomerase [Candidatus Omnitrophota bacterium]